MPSSESGLNKVNWKYAFLVSVIVLVISIQFLFLHGNTNSTYTPNTAPQSNNVAILSPTEGKVSKTSPPVSLRLDLETIRKEEPPPVSPLHLSENPVKKAQNNLLDKIASSEATGGTSGRLQASPMSWEDFVRIPYNEHFEKPTKKSPIVKKELHICPSDMATALAKPRLSDEDFRWCRWALSASGGQVVVGKSWGKLKSKAEKEKFDALNCNSVAQGKNPSCDDSWGDIHLRTWKKNQMEALRCSASKSSDLLCYKNDNNDIYCTMKNAQINFSKMKKISRSGNTPSKKFQNDFLSTDCKDGITVEDTFPFPHLYSPTLSTHQCDYTYNGTLLLYSHDDIRNLGHTLNDVFNVWIMLWMQGIARYEHQIEMLNVDSFKLGHNFDDQPNAFFTTYYKSLRGILKGVDFGDKTLCVKNLMIQPIPPRFFIWESWFVDLPCSFIGPSALYQRWNLDVRNNYGFLNKDRSKLRKKVLLVIRNEHSNMWGTQRTSRNFLNSEEIVDGLKAVVDESEFTNDFEFLGIDLGKLPFVEQLELIGETAIMVGMHGAGMASSMHMSIGEDNCCGVLEMFPSGEFSPIKGHGNMARKMGLFYDRMDISADKSQGNGAQVPVAALAKQVRDMMRLVQKKPTCVLETVIQDPYLEE